MLILADEMAGLPLLALVTTVLAPLLNAMMLLASLQCVGCNPRSRIKQL